MHKGARRLISVLAAASAVVAMSAAPALARPADGPAGQPVTTSWLSDTTEEAWDKWNEGGCLVGEGAAQMVSAAVVGLPWLAKDLASDKDHLSEPTELAWLTWNEGGGKVGQGTAQLISSAYIGVPSSVLDFFKAGLDTTAPEGAEWKTWNELTPAEQEFIGYQCGYIF